MFVVFVTMWSCQHLGGSAAQLYQVCISVCEDACKVKQISPSSVILCPVKLWELYQKSIWNHIWNLEFASCSLVYVSDLLHIFWYNSAFNLKKWLNEAMLLLGHLFMCVWWADLHYQTCLYMRLSLNCDHHSSNQKGEKLISKGYLYNM